MKPLSLERFPLHLGVGGRALQQPEFTGIDWYAAYADRQGTGGGRRPGSASRQRGRCSVPQPTVMNRAVAWPATSAVCQTPVGLIA